jgi:hypothetical protein
VHAKIAIFGRIVDLRTSTIVEDDLPKPETSAEHATSLPSYKIMSSVPDYLPHFYPRQSNFVLTHRRLT